MVIMGLQILGSTLVVAALCRFDIVASFGFVWLEGKKRREEKRLLEFRRVGLYEMGQKKEQEEFLYQQLDDLQERSKVVTIEED